MENDNKPAINNDSQNTAISTDDKQTNRTFTQSELDSMIAKAVHGEREKYEGFDEMKTQLDTLTKEKKNKELENKTELEKIQILFNEQTAQLTTAQNEVLELNKAKIRNEVLNDPKYSLLPSVYKNAVDLSDDPEAVKESAEKILNQYSVDMGAKGTNIPVPPVPNLDGKPKINLGTPAQQLSNITDRIKNRIKAKNF